VVTTGIDTLAEEAGREGFRIRDGPASSKLTHSIEELWEPAHQLRPEREMGLQLTKVEGTSVSVVPRQRVDIARSVITWVNDVKRL
jgi:F420-0:gamma-glutamyl ligase-like protein